MRKQYSRLSFKQSASFLVITVPLHSCALAPEVTDASSPNQFMAEYVGSEFVSQSGDHLTLNRDKSYRLSNGSTGSYRFTEKNKLLFKGKKTETFTLPSGFGVQRPDLGIEFNPVKVGDDYTLSHAATGSAAVYKRVPLVSASTTGTYSR